MMLDSHCHLDRYPDPIGVAADAARRGVFTVAVTKLPSHFRLGLPHARRLPTVRLALGLHPLAAEHHERELPAFLELLPETSFVGEIGLDFSKEGVASANRQVESLRAILKALSAARKFVTLHSRGAAGEVTRLLREFRISRAVFHWYTGDARTLDDILGDGHYVSANPAMVRSQSGQKVLRGVPRERVLTETDGPDVQVGREQAKPWDVALVEEHLASAWGMSVADVRQQIWRNFREAVPPAGSA
jgi:TatD DNase family protein